MGALFKYENGSSDVTVVNNSLVQALFIFGHVVQMVCLKASNLDIFLINNFRKI